MTNNYGLEPVCRSGAWDVSDVDGLSLTGLQPCFEDVILLSTAYLFGLVLLGAWRVSLLRKAGPFDGVAFEASLAALQSDDDRRVALFRRRSTIMKAACALVNVIAQALLLIEVAANDGADYEFLTLSLAIVGWMMVLPLLYLTHTRNSSSIRPGKWVPRFVFLWVFVANMVRWSSQRALGELDGLDYYWTYYLMGLVSQMAIVLMDYALPTESIFDSAHRETAAAGTYTAATKTGVVVAEDEEKSDAESSGIGDDNAYEKQLLPEDRWRRPDPERRANIFSKLTFTWMQPLVSYGNKHNIEDEDLWPLPEALHSEPLAAVFQKEWDAEKARARARGNSDKPPSLLRSIRVVFGRHFFLAAPLLLIQNVSQLLLPVQLGFLIEFIGDEDAPVYRGYLYSVGFFLALMLMTIAENAYFNRVTKSGMQVRGALVATIYRHALQMSSGARQAQSSGAIVSHMSVDTNKVQMSSQMLHNVWSSPTRLAMGLYLLIDGLGGSGAVGMACVLLMIPVQGRIMLATARHLKAVGKKQDARLSIINELLAGMRVIKYYAWEKPFKAKVDTVREEELSLLKKAQTWRALSIFMMSFNPILLALGTFVAFALINGNLTAAQAFTAVALFQQLLWPLMMFPRTISMVIETMVSVDRIAGFLTSETTAEAGDKTSRVDASDDATNHGLELSERKQSDAEVNDDSKADTIGVPITFEDASFQWEATASSPTLTKISLKAAAGKLTAIIGSTGSGKSSLLSAILGEMGAPTSGSVQVGGGGRPSVAYVPQQAWIFNATVRENIVFGLPWDEAKYWQAVRVACLSTDFEENWSESGDMTEIGERGVNLSGGQRQRISVARAVYADSQVVLFDDPLSALDAHVGAEMFRECIAGAPLAGKTRLLVTNQIQYMQSCDHVVVLDGGKVSEQGSFSELMAQNGNFAQMMRDQGQAESNEDNEKCNEEKSGELSEEDKRAIDRKAAATANQKQAEAKDKGRLVLDEKHAVGNVAFDVYKSYARSVGSTTFIMLMFSYILGTACGVSTNMWLAHWTEATSVDCEVDNDTGQTVCDEPPQGTSYYIGVYASLAIGQALLGLAANLLGFHGAVRASRVLHSAMTSSVLRAPMEFFDSTPLGQIVGRYTTDVSQIDQQIMLNLQLLLSGMFQILGTLTVIGINTTYVLVPFIPIMATFIGVQNFYRHTSVQLKRLDSVSKSPVYAHFTETLSGMSVIRAFGAESRMQRSNLRKVDANQKVYLYQITANRWLSIRLEFLGGLMILAAAVNCVLLRNSLTPAAVGVSMAYALQITSQLNMLVRFVAETEASFNAVERVNDYIDVKPEAPTDLPADAENPNWPSQGRIVMENLSMSYRKGMPNVLKGINLEIAPMEKVGVVGRTGAGKSTLFQALFRIVELNGGRLLFDGVDVAGLGLDAVRNAVSIIPQEPVLFAGSLRYNLDPFSRCEDHQLWAALERANLKPVIELNPLKLDMIVVENGENFSVGQRQLICLARALLQDTKILVLDEATANVDVETDALLQKTIRDAFANRTVLTIAHRLNTIIDSDKVLVLDAGTVREFDSPATLLATDGSEFAALVDETGAENAAFLRAVANGEVDIAAQQTALAETAKTQLEEDASQANRLARGPLMKMFDSAAATVLGGLDDRHDQKWRDERAMVHVSESVWLAHMVEWVRRLDAASKAACELDGLSDDDVFAQQRALNDDWADLPVGDIFTTGRRVASESTTPSVSPAMRTRSESGTANFRDARRQAALRRWDALRTSVHNNSSAVNK